MYIYIYEFELDLLLLLLQNIAYSSSPKIAIWILLWPALHEIFPTKHYKNIQGTELKS